MSVIDLGGQAWELRGWRPFSWELPGMRPDVGPLPARAPGSVQQALRDAGVLPDWNVGVNSRLCEWVEHRHWAFTTPAAAGAFPAGAPVVLEADGLDHSGWVLVDGKKAGAFEGSLLPHRFDLSDCLGDGAAHELTLVFEEPPREQGQMGYTSRSRHFKPRYTYSWDWCPRIVPIGPWDGLRLLYGPAARIRLARIETRLGEDLQSGELTVEIDLPDSSDTLQRVEGWHVRLTLCDGNREVTHATVRGNGPTRVSLSGFRVEPWWPNGEGAQKLYRVSVVIADTDGAECWRAERRVGFRRIDWRPCEGAPSGAEPWICCVNGKPVFLQGANWVPPRAVYHDAAEDDYRRLVGLYRDMGCTCLRVWGGGILEKPAFYDACDEAGIFVWQEFPLSSSGIENTPPDDAGAIAAAARIAASYIARRAHHASLLLWCGGNELTWPGDNPLVPVDDSHPCIAALRDAVHELDPGRRFIPTSPSGPRFCAAREEYGQGLHHDIHGPWGMAGFKDLDDWRSYWENDDALFRSEVGMPGAMDFEKIRLYAGGMPYYPPTGEYWLHTAAWWTQWGRMEAQFARKGIEEYVQETQRFQAEAYRIAAEACKKRFPRCGGFIVWMGHDCFPCPANNSVIDFDSSAKPAYYALRDIFRGR